MTGPRRLDLHVHSEFSPDGRSAVDEYARTAGSAGLGGFALTDHNSVGGHRALAELADRFPDLLLVPGIEISTEEGHLLAYGLREVPPRRLPIDAAVAWVRDRGGEPAIAHPFRRPHGAARRLVRPVAAAVEVVNGHNRQRTNDRAASWAAGRSGATTGGSDAHTVGELGRAWTEFPDGTERLDDALEALRRGRTRAGGASLTWVGWARWGWNSGWSRIARGLRAI